MLFALVNGEKKKAEPMAHGLCPFCKNPVIAKCGQYRVAHWAHSRRADCDTWWESETDWHRGWKNNFPAEWQEIIHHDPITQEKHVADVKTASNLVIEFQHSHITPEERTSREQFYQDMIWVVDGTRCKRDFPRFQKNYTDFYEKELEGGIAECKRPENLFPKDWLQSPVPVFFDFKGMEENLPSNDLRNNLFCFCQLLWKVSDQITRSLRYLGKTVPSVNIVPFPLIFRFSRELFLQHAKEGSIIPFLIDHGGKYIQNELCRPMRAPSLYGFQGLCNRNRHRFR